MTAENEKHKYPNEKISLDDNMPEPSYNKLLDWANDSELKSLALDIWARGNYVRYLFSRQKEKTPTVIVPFTHLDELRCYYRRMALMGLPAHFVYTGDLSPPQKCLTVHPLDKGHVFDSGVGWLAAMGTKYRTRGRDWFPIFGYSRPMPEAFVEWLTTEAAADFARGNAFLSPAELIGIPKRYLSEGIEMAAEVNDSTTLLPQLAGTELLFNLEIPHIDEIDHDTFSKILEDNDFRLARFRHAIKKLVQLKDGDDIDNLVEELKDEIAQIRLSDGTMRMRQTIAKFGGVFTTFSAGLSAYGATVGKELASLETIGPTIAGAATAGAVAAFVDIWKQANERKAKRRESRYSVLWDLGVKKPSDLKRTKSVSKIKSFNKFEPAILGENIDLHWLCKGTMSFLATPRAPT